MSEDKKRYLMGVPIFEKLDFNEMAVVEKIVSTCKFTEGDVILEEGSHGRSMYFVVDGILHVTKKKENSESHVLISEIKQGHSVGEMALIDGYVRSAKISAKTDGTFLALKRENFEDLQDSNPVIGMKILKGIAHLISMNLRKTSKQLTELMMPIA